MKLRRGNELGYKDNHYWVFADCPDCGKGRWTGYRKNKPTRNRCRACHLKILQASGESSHSWRGGRRYHNGYVYVYLLPNDFFRSMTNKDHYVLEHRLIMAKALGRCLHLWEIVHHRNHKKNDNRIENLQLVSDDKHKQISILENKINHLEQRVLLLEAENVKLQMQIGVVSNV